MTQLPTLSIYGAGKVGKTLARLWVDKKLVTVKDVFCRDRLNAQQAVQFIGAGTARGEADTAQSADIWLITCPDEMIPLAAQKLQCDAALRNNSFLLHCAGNSSSRNIAEFAPAASVHPVHSFAKPEDSLSQFSGTFCAAEGDSEVLAVAKTLFTAIGGHWLTIEPTQKHRYHAATVTASNHLVTLLDQALRLAQSAGLNTLESRALLKPLAQQALNNVFAQGASASLTGPISRGDTETVASHLTALENFYHGTQDLDLYHALARATLRIAAAQEQSPSRLAALQALLSERH